MSKKMKIKNMTIENRKAYYDYFVEDKFEAGISLAGMEVKSIRCGMCNLRDAYIEIKNGEVFARNIHITQYEHTSILPLDEKRPRKLLLHKSEIKDLENAIKDAGYTIIPLKIYFSNNNKVKMEIGLCKGKKSYDKRETLKKKTIERELKRFK